MRETIKLDSTNNLIQPGVQNPVTLAFINNATVTYNIYDPSNNSLASGPLTYVSSSNGNYAGSYFASSGTFTTGVVYKIVTVGTLMAQTLFTKERFCYAVWDAVPQQCDKPAPLSYNSSDPSVRLQVVRNAINAIMTGAQSVMMGTVNYRRADLNQLLAMEQYCLKAVAFGNGQYNWTVAELDNPDDNGAINMSL